MKLLKSKAGKLKAAMIEKAIIGLLVIVILFVVYQSIVPTAQASGDAMNQSNQCVASGCVYNGSITNVCRNGTGNSSQTVACATGQHVIPLSGLFSSTGVVFVLVMAALILLVVKNYLPKKGK